ALPQVIAQQGQVVLISSVFAFLNGMGTIPYAMSKAAVEQLGRGLRVELAGHGVSVLTAYFSLVQTDMIARGVDEAPVVLDLLGTQPGPCSSASPRQRPPPRSPTGSNPGPRASSGRRGGVR